MEAEAAGAAPAAAAAGSCFGMMMVGLLGVLVLAVGALATAFWIWMLIDCVTKETDEGNNRLIWVLIIIFLQAIGAAVYYFVRRRPRLAEPACADSDKLP